MSIWIKGFIIAVSTFLLQLTMVFLCGMLSWEENGWFNCDMFCAPNFFFAERGMGLVIQIILYYVFGLVIAKMFSYEKSNY